jgi:hypothetical protein
MATALSFTMTQQGKDKIGRAQKAVAAAVEASLQRTAANFKKRLAQFSPAPMEEAQLLSEGQVFESRTVTRGKRKGQFEVSTRVVGTPEGGRFLRRPPMMSLRRAIAASPVKITMTKTGVGRFNLEMARARDLNLLTGFSWKTKRRGVQGPTLPFDRKWVQALEYGGVWEVRRRGAELLNPEDGVLAGRMIKTVEPWGMYRQAKLAVRAEAKADLKEALSQALKKGAR